MGKGDKSETSQTFIEENLKRVYQETVEEDIPDRFKDLLDRLRRDEAEPEKGKVKGGKSK